MRKPEQLRAVLIALLAVAAALSVLGNKLNQPWLGWAATVAFLISVVLYLDWRRRLSQARRGRVFDREAKTRETRTRSGK